MPPRESIQEEVVTLPVVEELAEPVVAEEPQQPESPAVVVEEEILQLPQMKLLLKRLSPLPLLL